eukprot:15046427-Alexandrium_andersonii.AAC.1
MVADVVSGISASAGEEFISNATSAVRARRERARSARRWKPDMLGTSFALWGDSANLVQKERT